MVVNSYNFVKDKLNNNPLTPEIFRTKHRNLLTFTVVYKLRLMPTMIVELMFVNNPQIDIVTKRGYQ